MGSNHHDDFRANLDRLANAAGIPKAECDAHRDSIVKLKASLEKKHGRDAAQSAYYIASTLGLMVVLLPRIRASAGAGGEVMADSLVNVMAKGFSFATQCSGLTKEELSLIVEDILNNHILRRVADASLEDETEERLMTGEGLPELAEFMARMRGKH